MKKTLPKIEMLTALAASLLTSQLAHAQLTWTGASGADLLWSTPGNWSPSGPPGPSDDTQFLEAGETNDTVSVNNIVSADITVQSVWVGPTNGLAESPAAFNTLINPGVSLTVAGTDTATQTYYVGTKEYADALTTVDNTVRGEGGSLILNNTNNSLIVRQGHGSSGAHLATLDMSGLDTFNATLGRLLVGVGDSSYRRAVGNLTLAKTNLITLSGNNPELLVGDNSGNNNGNGSVSRLTLGQNNTLYVNSIRIGGQKQQGNMSFSSSSPGSSLIVRGSDGVSRVAEFGIGDESAQGGSGNPTTGRVDLGNGSVDILADTIYVGRGQTGTGREAVGFLTLGSGALDVNTLELGYQNAANAANRVDGTVNLIGTTAIVNDLLRLGRSAGSDAARNATLNMTGGSLTVVSNFVVEGTANLGFTNTLVNLPAGSAISANNLTVDGTTINNVSVLQVTNTLVLANGGVVNGVQSYDMGASGTASWYTESALTVSNTLTGAGFLYSDLIQAKGATLSPGGPGVVGTFYLSPYLTQGNLTLKGGTLPLDVSNLGMGINDSLFVSGNLSLQGTNDVPLTAVDGTLDTSSPYTIISYFGTLTGDASYFRIAGPLAKSRYTFTFSTSVANAITLSVGGSGSANLLWAGDGTANDWNLIGTANWLNGVTPDKFYNLDAVTFDDTGSASPDVNLTEVLLPNSITMNNSTKSYVFSGPGSLGSGSLTNNGAGGLTIANDGTNNFNYVDVESGTVNFINGSANNSSGGMNINVGASVNVWNTNANDFGPSIFLNGTLTFNQATDASLASGLSGGGNVIKNGTNILMLAGDNSGLYGNLSVNSGTLKAGNAKLLSAGANIVAAGATLDVNGFNLGLTPVTVSGAGVDGQGAIVNNNGNPGFVGPNLAYVNMVGNTTFGGTGRWDLRSAGGSTGDPSTAGLSTGGNSYNLTKVGTNGVYIVSATVDPMLGDIDVQGGILSFEGTTTSMGDPSKTLTVETGATLQFYNTTNLWDKHFVLNGDGIVNTINNANSDNTIVGSITLNGDCLFNAGGTSLTASGTISGSGSLIKTGGSRVILAGANTYTGSTVVSNGTLEVNGSIAGSGVNVEGGTLAGTGTINAPVVVNAGGTLSPGGNATASMNITGDVTLTGTTAMDADSTSGVFTSDLVSGVANLTLGGTLDLTLTGDPLAAGDSFTLFSATATTGAFDAIVPATPGDGLHWDTSELASSGKLKVAAGGNAPVITTVTQNGGNLEMSGTGGVPNGNYYVLTSTDLSVPLSNWTSIATNSFDASGNFIFPTPIDPGTPQKFYLIQLP